MNIGILIASICAVFGPSQAVSVNAPLHGTYVEARSCSVFAGACHYNGELTTSGRDAVMAWDIASGSFNGVNLAGVKVVAIVTSDENLSDDQTSHRAQIIVDRSAGDEQAAAAVMALREKCGDSLGQVVSVSRAAVDFTDHNDAFAVNASGIAKLSVQPMPNAECCKQPNLVWYSPLYDISSRRVGYTVTSAYSGGVLGDAWIRHGENSAFYGSF
ncbi:MAG TPA: DUF1326 domain-containing protein [Tepidisphaeraceae bacterium]|nr:DUF1326 domain-containing protein [Tepidisphaeraceae bacterium]